MAEPLIVDQDDRYSRLRLIGWWDQAKLQRSRVLVVGAGALGNEVIKNLVMVGVGHLIVIDLDTIENSNLTRSVLFRARHEGQSKAHVAAEMASEINPDVVITPIRGNVMTELGLGLFRDIDVAIGCLDNREARLWVNRCCWKTSTPWIDAGIQEISGVVKVFTPPESPCYECGMTENDYKLINLRYSCPLLPREDLLAGKVPTAPTSASIMAAIEVQEALKVMHGLPVNGGEAYVYSGLTNQFYTTRYQRKEDCLSHDTYPTAIDLPLSSETATAKDLFTAAAAHLPGEGPLTLHLDRDLVTGMKCAQCGAVREIVRASPLVTFRDAVCECREVMSVDRTHAIDESSPWADRSLKTLGIPLYDIVRITREATGEEGFFLLAADRDRVLVKLPADAASRAKKEPAQ